MVFTLYFIEIIGTFLLVLCIYAIVDSAGNVGPGANLWPFMVGLAVLAIGLCIGAAPPDTRSIRPAISALACSRR
jgi:glycerol uptake facilitator-like aquaporin